jgi:hypothetical protein
MDLYQLRAIIVIGGLVAGVLMMKTWYEVHYAAVAARKYFKQENARVDAELKSDSTR